MPIVFDPATKRIILDSASVTATELYSRSADWLALSDNAKYGAVFRQVRSRYGENSSFRVHYACNLLHFHLAAEAHAELVPTLLADDLVPGSRRWAIDLLHQALGMMGNHELVELARATLASRLTPEECAGLGR